MKKILVAIIAILLPMFIIAQDLSAYGVTLGDSKYVVEDILQGKGDKIKYSTNKLGEDVLAVSSPSIGGVNFDRVSFIFNKANKLRMISFWSSDSRGTGTPGMPWEAEFHRKASKCKNAALTMSQNLTLKYGEPISYTENKAIWQFGNQRITLDYIYIYQYDSYGWIDHEVSVSLQYSIIDTANADY